MRRRLPRCVRWRVFRLDDLWPAPAACSRKPRYMTAAHHECGHCSRHARRSVMLAAAEEALQPGWKAASLNQSLLQFARNCSVMQT